MLSRFFIDRPIFATVLSVVILLIGGIALAYLPVAQYPRITPPGVSISISYPGANAQVVADTVAAPIEQQVNGIPGMLYMSSQSGNDGTYSLACTFDVATNIDAALVMVQNRVTLALPLLPTPVQKQGISIRKKTPDILQIINLTSPDGRYDDLYLSNYALLYLRDELLRVDGVSDVNIFGERDYSIRIWLDPQELASRNMTALDVAAAVMKQNIEAAPGQIGQPPMPRNQQFQLPIDTLGRLFDPEQFRDIVVKTSRLRPPTTPKAATAAAAASTNSGLPSSGMTDPLKSITSTLPSTNKQTSSSTFTQPNPATAAAAATSTSSTGTADTSSGASGGATTGGGSTAIGGGTTGGAASSSAPGITLPATGLTMGGATNATVGNGVLSARVSGKQSPATAVVRLRDVARVEMGGLNYNQLSFFDGRPAVGLAVFQLPGTNALDVGDRVKAKIKELATRFPEGVTYNIGYDTTPFIRESIAEVFKTLRDAVILVAIVVLLFLQDWRAMILPMIDVPVSLIGTFAVMAALGYSLNNISLFGLVLAIGIVVDDAIVVLENIERQMAKGLGPRAATLKAMEEITGPIIAITLVLSAVFVPCAFISGITGRFFTQFAVTIAASTIISAINALTMTPSRALLIFRGEKGEATGTHHHVKEALPWWIVGFIGGALLLWLGPTYLAGRLNLPAPTTGENAAEMPTWLWWTLNAAWFTPGLIIGLIVGWFVIGPINAALRVFFAGFNYVFDTFTAGYGTAIGGAMRVSVLMLVVYVGLLGLTWWLFGVAPTGFVPQQDMGRCIGAVQLPDGAALERTRDAILQIEKIARDTPGVAHTIAVCGMSFVQQTNGPNFGSLFIILDPFDKRQRPELKDEAIMKRLRKEWARKVPDAMAVIFGAAPIPGLSVAGGFKFIVEDRGGLGVRNLQEQTDRLIQRLQKEPGLTGVSTQFRSGIPQLFLDIDMARVSALGLSPDDVNQTMEIYQGSRYVNSFNVFGRHWQVTLQADAKFRSDVGALRLLEVRNKAGQMVSMGTVSDLREISGPLFINRYNLSVAAPITGSLKPGASTGTVLADVDKAALDALPRTMKTDWTELMFLQRLEGNTTPPSVVFTLSVLFVFLALSALYESWTLPLAVILVVPMCVLCSVTGILIAKGSVNIFVQIGLVVLIGLACKNAILIVEFARELHEAGKPVLEATQEAARLRLRPILMTSLAFILGVMPLVFASGAGAEMRRSLGTAVFSGMIGVTVFGAVLTPVFFYVIQGYGEAHAFTSQQSRIIASGVVGLALGLGGGYLVGRLGILPMFVTLPIGACLGLLSVLAAIGLSRRFRTPQKKLATEATEDTERLREAIQKLDHRDSP
jgi:multidrug efflux pump